MELHGNQRIHWWRKPTNISLDVQDKTSGDTKSSTSGLHRLCLSDKTTEVNIRYTISKLVKGNIDRLEYSERLMLNFIAISV